MSEKKTIQVGDTVVIFDSGITTPGYEARKPWTATVTHADENGLLFFADDMKFVATEDFHLKAHRCLLPLELDHYVCLPTPFPGDTMVNEWKRMHVNANMLHEKVGRLDRKQDKALIEKLLAVLEGAENE